MGLTLNTKKPIFSLAQCFVICAKNNINVKKCLPHPNSWLERPYIPAASMLLEHSLKAQIYVLLQYEYYNKLYNQFLQLQIL